MVCLLVQLNGIILHVQRRWKSNIEIDLLEIVSEFLTLINLAEDRLF